MTLKRFRATVAQIRYKPGWSITVDESGDVVVAAYGPDSRKPGMFTTHSYFVTTPRRIARMKTADVVRGVLRAIRRVEAHEFGEWFRYRGRRPLDPHVR